MVPADSSGTAIHYTLVLRQDLYRLSPLSFSLEGVRLGREAVRVFVSFAFPSFLPTLRSFFPAAGGRRARALRSSPPGGNHASTTPRVLRASRWLLANIISRGVIRQFWWSGLCFGRCPSDHGILLCCTVLSRRLSAREYCGARNIVRL